MLREWLRAPRRVRPMFLGVMLLLAATLGWVGWRMLSQERQLAAQRLAEYRETAADLVVAGLERQLSAVEKELTGILASGKPTVPTDATDGTVLVHFHSGSIEAWPPGRLIFYPELPGVDEAPPALFAAADDLEFRQLDYAAAIRALRVPAASADARVRAAALVRMARNYFKDGEAAESLAAYDRLSALGGVSVGGMPAALAASFGALGIFDQRKDGGALGRTALTLYRDLHSGRWPVSSAAYHHLEGEARRWLRHPEPDPGPGKALSEGIESLWDEWRRGGPPSGGRASVATPSGPVLLVWHAAGPAMAAFAACPGYVEKRWLAEMRHLLASRGVRLALATPDGRLVVGAEISGQHPAVRLAPATQLPWTVQVFSDANGGETAEYRLRRGLLVAGMAVLLLLILTGGWFVGRSVERELAVARLQSDFVSAVSHEFRTPLTTLYQLSELLVRGRVAGEDDRRQYYELLHKESDRLRRLVGGLLNFGRIEAGRVHYRFERVDAAALVRQAAAEFGQARPSHRLEVAAGEEPAAVRGDCEALHCVLWNLFENAAKYSPDCDTVWVDVAKNGRGVGIAVRDRGVGIPRAEQRRIFEKFVRGAEARLRNIRGAGIGLAMSLAIVRAHGGDITVESELGKGSTFRVRLPGVE